MKSYSLFTPTLAASVFSLICGVSGALTPMAAVGLVSIGFSPGANAFTCATADDKMCKSAVDPQYAGGFSPTVGFGGFGGAAGCTVTRTPVIFVHGNTDWAYSLAANTYQVPGYSKPPNSVYQELKNAGYKDCEIYGVNYLTSSERGSAAMNFHKESKFDIINGFVNQVKTFTGKTQVDIISHSFGVSMSIATLHYYNNWAACDASLILQVACMDWIPVFIPVMPMPMRQPVAPKISTTAGCLDFFRTAGHLASIHGLQTMARGTACRRRLRKRRTPAFTRCTPAPKTKSCVQPSLTMRSVATVQNFARTPM